MRTSTLNTNTTLGTATRHDFAAETLYFPETTRSFAKANGGRVRVKVSALLAHTAATDLDGVRIGIKINAVAFDDLDVTVALANSGNTWRAEMTRDVTDYFSTNDPGTASFTCQVGVAFATGAAGTVTAITAELETTYAYDSAASTWADTAIFPIQSGLTSPPSSAGASWTEMGVDGTGAAPTNQIRKLTGSGGAFENVTGFTLRKRYLVVMANYNSTTVSFPVPLRYQIDGAGATALSCFGGNIGGAGTSNRVYATVDITALSTSAAHKLEWSMDIVAGFEHLGCLDVVTYEYTKPGSGGTCFVSIQVPLVNTNGDNTGTPARLATAGDSDRWSATFDVQEVSPTLDQSGVVLWDGHFGGGTDTILAATGQTERTYDRSTVSARDGWNAVVHRCDHTSSTWAVTRGRNVLSVDVRTSATNTSIGESSGIAYINYRCTRHPGGGHKHNRTILAAQLMSYTEGTTPTVTPDEPVIVPTNYTLSGAYAEHLLWINQAGVVMGIGAQRQSGEDNGKGWYRSGYTGNALIAELGSLVLIHPMTKWFRSRPGLPDGADAEAERKWHCHVSTSTSAGHHAWLYVTLHSCTYSVSGTVTINGSAAANGKTVKVWAVDASNRTEYIGSTTTGGGTGAYSLTGVPDDARTYWASYVDGSNRGRSADGTPDSTTFDIGVGAAPTPDVIITGFPSTLTTLDTATFTFTCSPGSAEYSVDGGSYSAATSPINLSGLSDGSHTITIRSTTDTSHLQSFTWTVDSGAGSGSDDVIITSTPIVTSDTSSATFTFTSTDSAEYSLDGSAYASATSPIVLTGLSVGGHVLTIRMVSDPTILQSFWWTVTSVDAEVLEPIEAPTTSSDLPVVDHVSAGLARLCQQFRGTGE
jgi:hypothetical protein